MKYCGKRTLTTKDYFIILLNIVWAGKKDWNINGPMLASIDLLSNDSSFLTLGLMIILEYLQDTITTTSNAGISSLLLNILSIRYRDRYLVQITVSTWHYIQTDWWLVQFTAAH